MANNVHLGVAAANAEADAISVLCNSGTICLYDGTQPATADTAISDQLKYATLTFAATARSGSSADGVATFAAIVKDSAADRSGTPTWFRAWKQNGTDAVFDGTVGLSGCDCNIDALPISSGAEVTCTSMTYTANRG
jgi:hypothetical protein